MVALAEFGHGTHGALVCAFLEQYAKILSGLFFELPTEYQADIDEFMAAGTINGNLRRLFEGAAREGKPGVADDTPMILSRAKELGVRVICFDATKKRVPGLMPAEDGHYFVANGCRDADMAQNILAHYERGKKYAVLVGAGHLRERTLDGKHPSFGTRMRESTMLRFAAVRLVRRGEVLPAGYSPDMFEDTMED